MYNFVKRESHCGHIFVKNWKKRLQKKDSIILVVSFIPLILLVSHYLPTLNSLAIHTLTLLLMETSITHCNHSGVYDPYSSWADDFMDKIRRGSNVMYGIRESQMSSHASQKDGSPNETGKTVQSACTTTLASRASADALTLFAGGGIRVISPSIYGNEDAIVELMEKVKRLNNHPAP